MKKRGLFAIVFLGLFLISLTFVSAAPQINLINMTPSLDFTRFSPYNITANITNISALTSVQINVSGINGDGVPCWDYYTNGTCASEVLNFNMTYDSLDIWKKQNIYPDFIYPEIFFAPPEITWNNQPSDISMWRRNYHLFNFTNPFSMVENMSFWVEFNALASNDRNSNELFVYIVGNGSSGIGLDYFENDWRIKDNTELVATFSREDVFHHTHTTNSSHLVVALATNSDGTIGTKNINASDNFWVVLYQDSTNVNRGWNLRYQDSSLCNNQNAWYIADRSGGGTWNTPVSQVGCPDAHIHIARNNVGYLDGVNATVIATDENSNINISSQDFYYGELANLAPNPDSFTSPVVGGVYNETFINITWNPATDPNPGDILTYNISLLNSDESFNQTLNVTTTNSYYWNVTDISDGNYNLRLEICDDASPSLCVNSTLGGNFTLDKTNPIYSLTSRTIISNNSFNSTLANSGDLIIVYFNSSGTLTNPRVTFYSGGYEINNPVTIANTSNHYNATYVVNESDIDGGVDFEIIADNLDMVYVDSDDSDIVVDKTPPSLEIISPTATNYTNATQSLNMSASDIHLDSIWYNWNGTNITYVNPLNIVFSEGSNTLSVWTNDSLGNFNSTNVTFTIDTTAPTLSIISPTNTTYTTSSVIVNITNSSDAVSVWWNNGTANLSYTSPVTLTLVNGDYTFTAYANDSSGNLNFTSINFSVNVNSPSYYGIRPQTYFSNERLPTEGNNFELRWNDKIKFTVRTANHTLTMQKFNSTHIKVKIESEPMIFWLEKDVLYEFDLNNDSVVDIRVRYEGRNNFNKAKVFIQEIVYAVEESVIAEDVVEDIEDEEKSLRLLWVVLGLVVFIILVYIFLKQKSVSKKSSFRKRSKI